jgi:cobalt transporter subunit CbtB
VQRNTKTVGCDGMETMMTTKTLASSKATALMSVLFVAMIGASTVFLSGFAHSQTLHDAAHDVRHASGFPCH